MAQRIRSLKSKRSIYPWSKWTTGKWRVTKGTDFKVSVSSFRNAAYMYAARHGMRVLVSQKSARVLEFEFSKSDQKKAV